MRMSCNGCRVLRKACSDNCSIRPCLQWIKSPEAEANATLFLAKFYGRAGLINLINAAPQNLHRHSIFRSLLHEACGRIVNPISGSAGLFSTGRWQLCVEAVEAVLTGSPITPLSIEPAVDDVNPLFKACDIRHVSKKEKRSGRDLNKIKNRNRFKRSKPKAEIGELSSDNNSVSYDDSKASRSGGHDDVSIETVEDTLVKPNDMSNVGLDLKLTD